MPAEFISVKALFQAAIDLKSDPERTAFLDSVCGSDPQLRGRVEALLEAHDYSGLFLETAASVLWGDEAPTDQTQALDTRVGSEYEEVERNLNFLDPPLKPGSLGQLHHYDVLAVIGQGAFGIVLKAFDEKLHRMVALKVMAPELATNAAARHRFLREARASAAVRHENVINIHDVDEKPIPYLVMEFVAGQTLQDKVARSGPLATAEVLRVGLQIALGLEAAHKQGLVHRDIKPANILLENGVERVKITDFGLARATDDVSLTATGTVAGTPLYMSPEQAAGEAIDHRADLFSLGSTLYMMSTGHAPFRANSAMAVLKRVCEESPRPIRESNPDIPEWLCDLIGRLHEKKPSDRFSNAREVADLFSECLTQWQAGGAVQTAVRRKVALKRTPRHLRWIAAALILLPLLVLGITEATGVTEWTGIVARSSRRQKPDHPPPPMQDDGWVRMFNGKDLTGWKPHPESDGKWRVEDGALTCSGMRGTLYTERFGYGDFQLRVEAKLSDGGDGGIFLRVPYNHAGVGGYEVMLDSNDVEKRVVTRWQGLGQAWKGSSIIPGDQWFSMEIKAEGARIVVAIDGKTVLDMTDDAPVLTPGYIALQHLGEITKVQYRKVEIKELKKERTRGEE